MCVCVTSLFRDLSKLGVQSAQPPKKRTVASVGAAIDKKRSAAVGGKGIPPKKRRLAPTKVGVVLRILDGACTFGVAIGEK